MRVYHCTAYFNKTSRFNPYTEGDTLTPSKLGVLTFMSETPEAAASDVFTALNADDRANGRYERSLSVGDVVVLEADDNPAHVTRLACEPVGWREV